MTTYRKAIPLLDRDFEGNDDYLTRLIENTHIARSRQMSRHILEL